MIGYLISIKLLFYVIYHQSIQDFLKTIFLFYRIVSFLLYFKWSTRKKFLHEKGQKVESKMTQNCRQSFMTNGWPFSVHLWSPKMSQTFDRNFILKDNPIKGLFSLKRLNKPFILGKCITSNHFKACTTVVYYRSMRFKLYKPDSDKILLYHWLKKCLKTLTRTLF